MVRLTALKTGAAISVLALLAFSGSAIPTATPAAARIDVSIGLNYGGIGFGYFHRNLNRSGHWINHPVWGDVWVPPRGYRPYYNGYWTYSDYGLLWVGYDRWSNITEHYGRWIYDPYYRAWLWIPGYVWSPGWVVWRTGGGYFGWLAMPPDYGDYYDGPYFGGRYGWDDYYGYSDWYGLNRDSFYGLWIFVDDNHFYRRDYRNYAFHDSSRVRNIINNTNDSTNYTIQGDRVINRSITADRLERMTHQRIQPVEARRVLKGDVPMATVAGGRALARQEGSGQSGPHFHDRNFQPVHARGGKSEGAAAPLIQREPDRNVRGRNRGGENEATPSPQPQPKAGEERGRNRGGENEAAPSPQPQPKAGGERGRNRGGENEAAPSPQPQPQGSEERGRGRGNAEGKPQGAGPGTEQGTQGRERPNAGEKKPAPAGEKKPATAGEKKPAEEQPANPDEEKKKKRNREDTGPNDNGPGR